MDHKKKQVAELQGKLERSEVKAQEERRRWKEDLKDLEQDKDIGMYPRIFLPPHSFYRYNLSLSYVFLAPRPRLTSCIVYVTLCAFRFVTVSTKDFEKWLKI